MTPQRFSTIVHNTELSIVQFTANVAKLTFVMSSRRMIEVITTLRNELDGKQAKSRCSTHNPPSMKKKMTKAFCVIVILSRRTSGIGNRTKTKSAMMFGIEVPKKKPFRLTHFTPGCIFAMGSQLA